MDILIWPFDKPIDGLKASSRPIDAYNKFIGAEDHESFDKLRTISPRIGILAGGLEQEKGTLDLSISTLFASKWLPMVNVLRDQFASPSKEMMDTLLVVQNQMKDGFLAGKQL